MSFPNSLSIGTSNSLGVYENTNKSIKNPGESNIKTPGKESSPAECEACSSRKYMDASNESVSFKSPTHVSPEDSFQRVSAHEKEHVSNAYSKASSENGKVVSAFVTLSSKICPECGRSYIAGGETTTQIKYYNESNPYQQNKKAEDSIKYQGLHVNQTP